MRAALSAASRSSSAHRSSASPTSTSVASLSASALAASACPAAPSAVAASTASSIRHRRALSSASSARASTSRRHAAAAAADAARSASASAVNSRLLHLVSSASIACGASGGAPIAWPAAEAVTGCRKREIEVLAHGQHGLIAERGFGLSVSPNKAIINKGVAARHFSRSRCSRFAPHPRCKFDKCDTGLGRGVSLLTQVISTEARWLGRVVKPQGAPPRIPYLTYHILLHAS